MSSVMFQMDLDSENGCLEDRKTDISDADLADILVARLNDLIKDPDGRPISKDLLQLIENRVPCSEATINHPTLQTFGDPPQLGLMGVLNGLLKTPGYSWIMADVDEDCTRVTRFHRRSPP